MGVSELVAKVANPYFTLHEDLLDVTDESIRSSIKFAVKNKVFPLFYEGCLKLGISLPNEAELLMESYEKRRRMQIDAVELLIDMSDKLGTDMLFFKTFRPFNYIPDDVDVLLRDEKDLKPLITKLKEKGYFILKVGTPEIVLRKVGKDAYVDLDIHNRLAVGHFDIFRVERLWQEHACEAIKIGDGYEVLKLSENYEIVREAAYSLLKDFTLSIPGLYLAINAMLNMDLKIIEKIAVKWNLFLPLNLYLGVAYYATHALFGTNASSQLKYDYFRYTNKNDLKIASFHFRKRFRVPYPYPISIIAWAYLSKVHLEVSRNRNIGAIFQLMGQPSSKGIDILLNYLKEYLF